MYVLWVNFILGLNFFFFVLSSLSYITLPYLKRGTGERLWYNVGVKDQRKASDDVLWCQLICWRAFTSDSSHCFVF